MPVRTIVVDHVLLVVSDLEASRRFYNAALRPLGFAPMNEELNGLSYGVMGSDDFAIYQGDEATTNAHVAFVAPDREAVESFYSAAMGAGGREKLPPALHPEYHPNYYAAFVFDPDGNNIEAVHHGR